MTRQSLSTVSPPSSEPITLAEAKAHLRVEHSDEDALIASLLSAAREQVETDTRRTLMTTTRKLTLDGFPANNAPLLLSQPPLQSVTSIRYLDTDGTWQTLSAETYTVTTGEDLGRVGLVSGEVWPDVQDQIGAVEVTYVCGYASRSLVPSVLKAMVLLLLGHWYEHREAAADRPASEIPLGYERLVHSQRVGSYA